MREPIVRKIHDRSDFAARSRAAREIRSSTNSILDEHLDEGSRGIADFMVRRRAETEKKKKKKLRTARVGGSHVAPCAFFPASLRRRPSRFFSPSFPILAGTASLNHPVRFLSHSSALPRLDPLGEPDFATYKKRARRRRDLAARLLPLEIISAFTSTLDG